MRGQGGSKSRLLNDPRRMPEPQPAWEEQVDAAYALEAAEPTGTVGVTLRPSPARSVVESRQSSPSSHSSPGGASCCASIRSG